MKKETIVKIDIALDVLLLICGIVAACLNVEISHFSFITICLLLIIKDVKEV